MMQNFSAVYEAQQGRRVPPSQRSVLSEGKTVFAVYLESIYRFLQIGLLVQKIWQKQFYIRSGQIAVKEGRDGLDMIRL